MTVSSALQEVARQWAAADAAARTLRLTTCEDPPAASSDDDERRPPPVERAGEFALELVAILGAGSSRLDERPDDALDGDYATLSFLQDRKLEADERAARLSAPELLLGLAREAVRRGGEWLAWWSAASRGIEELQVALRQADAALVQCWREFSERPQVRLGSAAIGRLYVKQPANRDTTQEATECR
jgi:hypothetical protein